MARRSGARFDLASGLAGVVLLAVVVWPAVSLLSVGDGGTAPAPEWGTGTLPGLLAVTAGYALGVAALATLVGWLPGCVLGSVLHPDAPRSRMGWLLATLTLVPLCLPSYVIFYTWWQAWPADSAVYAWAVRHGAIGVLRSATLVVALVAWAWPLVAWCVGAAATHASGHRDELLRIDGASRWRRGVARLRADGRGLLTGGTLVFCAVFVNTTCFDLAQIFTYGNELRALDAAGSSPAALVGAALPALVIAAITAVAIMRLLGGRADTAAPPGRRSRVAAAGAAIIWLLLVGGPLSWLLLRCLAAPAGSLQTFLDLYGHALAAAVAIALASGGVATLVALGLVSPWHGSRVGGGRTWAWIQTLGWLMAALVPGTIAGLALEAAYNRPVGLGGVGAELVYRTPVVLVLAHLTRFGFVAALFAWWCAAREPRRLADLRRIDGAVSGVALWRAAGPRLTSTLACVFAVVAVLSLGEITVTARVQPPGSGALSVALLNAMHYQRPETVVNAALVMVLGAVVAATILALTWVVPRARRVVAAGLVCVLLTACGGDGEARPLPTNLAFGRNGTALGQFSYPRCIDADRTRGVLYVVDKTARVQRFGLDGVPQVQWRMPAREQGKPTGVSVAPDGRVFVADTHYYRVIAFTPDGEEVLRFGSYGQGPGEFIYPTDIAFGPGGRLYVAEYGGHDRIQVFSPDGTYEFEFGALGAGPGEFSRPQSIEFDPGGRELYITDACNHRILVTDPVGRPLRQIGRPGSGPGELHYPYGLTFLSDGSLLVAEFGNNRLQRFDPDGTPRGRYGTVGAVEGALRYPWGVTSVGGSVYVLDSGNNRVQRMDEP